MEALLRCVGAVLIVAALTSPAAAQSRPAPAVELTGGWAGFVDNATIDHAVLGVAVRWRVSRRISVGPEVVYMLIPRRPPTS